MKKRRVVKNDGLSLRGVLIGIGVMALILVLASLAVSLALYLTEDPTGHTVLLSSVTLFVSGSIGGFAVSARSDTRTATVASVCVSVMLVLLGWVSAGAAPDIRSIINAVAYVLAAVIFAKIAEGRGKRRIRR